MPQLQCAPQLGQGSRRLATRERHGSAGVHRHRCQRVACLDLRCRRELSTGALGLVDLAGRERDLHVRGEQRRSLQLLAALTDDPADRGQSGVDSVLGQPEQCQSRLRLLALPGCRAIRPLRCLEVATQAMQVSLHAERPAEGPLVQHSLVGDVLCLLEGRLPASLQLHDLRPMDQADAGVGHHVGLTLAPEREGGGPFPGAAQLVHALTDRDRVAVEDAGHDRRELAARDRGHALVHEPEPLSGSSELEERVTQVHDAQRDQVAIAEALADGDGLGCLRPRCLEVAFPEALEHRPEEEVAALDTVAFLALEQPLSAGEPACRRGCFPAEQETEADPPGTADGLRRFARVEVGVMSTLEGTNVLVLETSHIGRRREQHEILRLQPARVVGARERLVGIAPRMFRERVAAALERTCGRATVDAHGPHSGASGTRARWRKAHRRSVTVRS